MFYEMMLLLLREWCWHNNNRYTIEVSSGDETRVNPCHEQPKYNIIALLIAVNVNIYICA